jgi:SAM-dependent methyltransferase
MNVSDILVPEFARQFQRRVRGILAGSIDHYMGVITVEHRSAALSGLGEVATQFLMRPFGWAACWRVLRQLPPPAPGEAFLDVGCGSGRMVLAAARKGYSRVLGLEIRPELAAIAARNTASMRQPSSRCEVIVGDATIMEVPDDVSALFIYNPFQGVQMDRFLDRLMESLARRPRRLIVAYANPVEHDRAGRDPRLQPFRRIHVSWRPTKEWRRCFAVQFYRAVPPPARP